MECARPFWHRYCWTSTWLFNIYKSFVFTRSFEQKFTIPKAIHNYGQLMSRVRCATAHHKYIMSGVVKHLDRLITASNHWFIHSNMRWVVMICLETYCNSKYRSKHWSTLACAVLIWENHMEIEIGRINSKVELNWNKAIYRWIS